MLLTLMLACPGEPEDSGGETAVDPEICDNATDDDGDTYTDCFDPDCYTAVECERHETNCTDGADEDGDKRQDCADDDCTDDPACAGVENCTNEVDDDEDGATDC